MDANSGYCSAQLKLALKMAQDGYFDSSITAVAKGLERLLEELFSELRDKDKSNLIALSVAYDDAKRKRNWSRSKNGQKILNLYGWIKFYQNNGIFSKLEETCGYDFDDFNGDNLHRIRMDRNEFGPHPDEQYDTHRKVSKKLIDLYSNILYETGRITQPRSIVLRNQLHTAKTQELLLLPNEEDALKRQYDDILRIEPNNLDVLFQRAYLFRGQKTANDDIEKILSLNPKHAEARKERNWNREYRKTAERAHQRSTININLNYLTQTINHYKFINNRPRVMVIEAAVIFVAVVSLFAWQKHHNEFYSAELRQLHTTVASQSSEIELVENDLQQTNALVETINADLQQKEATRIAQSAKLPAIPRQVENEDALNSGLDLENNAELQRSAEVESHSGALEAIVNSIVLPVFTGSIALLFVVYIVAWIAWRIVSRYILPVLVKWMMWQLRWALRLLIKSSLSWMLNRVIPWRRKSRPVL